MKRALVLFWIFAASAAGSACSADIGSLSTGSFGGGEGATGTTSAATGATSVGTGATSVGVTGAGGSGGEDDAGIPGDCATPTSCGNFGAGCVKCAVKTVCAAEYQACFNDAPCKSYSICVEPCEAKDVGCFEACATELPVGAAEYEALLHCVICGDCATLCEHGPGDCK